METELDVLPAKVESPRCKLEYDDERAATRTQRRWQRVECTFQQLPCFTLRSLCCPNGITLGVAASRNSVFFTAKEEEEEDDEEEKEVE